MTTPGQTKDNKNWLRSIIEEAEKLNDEEKDKVLEIIIDPREIADI